MRVNAAEGITSNQPLIADCRPLMLGRAPSTWWNLRALQLLYHAKTEREAEIQPHGRSDDLGREPIPGVAGPNGCRHPTRLPTLTRWRKGPQVPIS